MLKSVTITGADDATPISALEELSAEFPFMEWGILVSLRAEGSSRFPSRPWIEAFTEMAIDEDVAVSMHVCGEWVRRLLRGKMDWGEFPAVRIVADRVQINTHAQEHVSTSSALDWMDVGGRGPWGRVLGVRRQVPRPKQFIFQLDGVNDHIFDAASARGLHSAGLFDCSHGAGVLPGEWPTPRFHQRQYGYAGGLGPDNVLEQIAKIKEARRNLDFWIDMEGRVRDEDDHLDLAKVRSVLETCAPLIGKE